MSQYDAIARGRGGEWTGNNVEVERERRHKCQIILLPQTKSLIWAISNFNEVRFEEISTALCLDATN